MARNEQDLNFNPPRTMHGVDMDPKSNKTKQFLYLCHVMLCPYKGYKIFVVSLVDPFF